MTITLDMMEAVFGKEGLSASDKLVFFALAYHANHQTSVCWPSRETLMKETSLSYSSVHRSVAALCRAGLVRRKRVKSGMKYWIADVNEIVAFGGREDVTGTCTPRNEMSHRQLVHVTQTVGSCHTDTQTLRKNIKKELKNPPIPPQGGGGGGDLKSFEVFWSSYPSNCLRKVEKAQCAKTYAQCRAAAPDPAAFDAMCLDALGKWKRSALWAKDGGAFIRSPLTWLRKRSWLDEPAPKGVDATSTSATAASAATSASAPYRTPQYKLRMDI